MARSLINRGRERREQLRARAQQLAEARSTRSPNQQLELLDERLGVGVGAIKERAKLEHELDEKRSTQSRQKKSRPPPSNKKGERRKAKARRNDERKKSKGGRRDV